MKYFPMFLDMTGRTVLLAGGGEQIAQKCRLLKRTTAELVIMSEELIPELAKLVEDGRARHLAADVDEAGFEDADYAFVATEDDDLDLEVAERARAGGAFVNVIDKPDQCDMIFPAIVDRDPVVAAIGTEGAAPVVAKAVKTVLEGAMSPRLGSFVRMLAARRGVIADNVPEDARLEFWRWATEDEPWLRWLAGDEAASSFLIDSAITAGRALPGDAEEAGAADIALVVIPSSPDLIPMRAVQRMQQARSILHGASVDIRLLDYARRDADRVVLEGCPRADGYAQVSALAAKGPLVLLCDAACELPSTIGRVERITPGDAA